MKQNRLSKKLLLVFIPLAIIASAVLLFEFYIHAETDVRKNECVEYAKYADQNVISKGTILQGIYLIDINQVNNVKVKALAKTSADKFSQDKIYYKSEIGDGKWYEITNAKSIKDIEISGTEVSEEELAGLLIKYYVDENGEIHDLFSKETLEEEIDPDFYNLWAMEYFEDLRDLEVEYEAQSKGNDDYAYYANYMKAILNLGIGTDSSNPVSIGEDLTPTVEKLRNSYDVQIELLNTYKEKFNTRDEDEIKTLIDELDEDIEALFSEKKYVYYGVVLSKLADESVKGCLSNPNHKPDSKVDNTISDCYNLLVENDNDSFDKCVLEPIDRATELELSIYKIFKSIVSVEQGTSLNQLKDYLEESIDLKNIRDENVTNKERELKRVEAFLPTISDKFSKAVSSGMGNISIDSQKENCDLVKEELQFMITAKNDRVSSSEKVLFLEQRILWTYDLYHLVKDDEFADSANSVIDEHLKWLKEEYDKALAELDPNANSGELENLLEQESKYESQKEQAERDNDLAEADRIQQLIDDIKERIDDVKVNSETGIKGDISLEEKLAAKISEDINNGTATMAEMESLEKIGFGDLGNSLFDDFFASDSGASDDDLAELIEDFEDDLNGLKKRLSETDGEGYEEIEDEIDEFLSLLGSISDGTGGKDSKSLNKTFKDISDKYSELSDMLDDLFDLDSGDDDFNKQLSIIKDGIQESFDKLQEAVNNSQINDRSSNDNNGNNGGSGDSSDNNDNDSVNGNDNDGNVDKDNEKDNGKDDDNDNDNDDKSDEGDKNKSDKSDGDDNANKNLKDNKKNLSAEQLAAINNLLDGLMGSADGMVVAAVVTDHFYQDGYDQLGAISKIILCRCLENKNPYIYYSKISENKEYVSLKAISKVLDYRYLTGKAITKQKTNRYYDVVLLNINDKHFYGFTKNKIALGQNYDENKVFNLTDKVSMMKKTYYISEDDSEGLFKCHAEPLSQSVRHVYYSAVFTENMQSQADELVKQINEILE